MLHIVERVWRVNGEAYQDDVRLGVGKGPQALVIFLAGRIPQSKLYGLAVHSAVGYVVFEDGWDLVRAVNLGSAGT